MKYEVIYLIGKEIGEITKNTEFGLYGNISNLNLLNLTDFEPLEVALRSEIKEGKATILSDIDGKTKEYSIEIDKEEPYLNDKLDGELITLPMNTLLLLDVGLDRLYDLKNIIDSTIEVKNKS